MSSNSMITPAVSLSEIRGTQAAERLKNAGSEANAAKIQKSAKDFESVLLSHWLEQAEQSFASVPGSDPDEDADPGRDQFHALAMQAVGAAMSGAHGGLGIAAMVAKHLQALKSTQNDPYKPLEIKPLLKTPIPEGTK